MRVAFAGHKRPEDLGEPGRIAEGLAHAFGLLKSLDRKAVLLTGLAEGADHAAVQTWSDLSLGKVHAVVPFLTDDSEGSGIVDRRTWLDGASIEAAGGNPHAFQSRWLLEDVDLLVVVWDGEGGKGAGGTADAVRTALERRVPVLWVKPGDPDHPRIIRPDAIFSDFSFLEFLEQVQRDAEPLVSPATLERLEGLLPAKAAAPAGPPRRPIWLLRFVIALYDRLLDATIWKTFALYRRALGGKPPKAVPAAPPPASLIEQDGFRLLTEAYEAADMTAGRLAAVHRSQQVFQALVMLAAATIGTAPAIWPQLKIYSVCGELGLAVIAFIVWQTSVRSERSRRWGEARRLAEQLRLERAAWALGLSTRDDRRFSTAGPAARAAWSLRREAGCPVGRFDPPRVAEWGGWAVDVLLIQQQHYHAVQGHLNHRLSHRGHVIETFVFTIFVALLATFAVAYFWARHADFELPVWLGGMLILAGAITPAFGAASLALESSLALGEQARHSQLILQDLRAIQARLPASANLDGLQRAARAAIRVQISQEERWSDDASHRHLVRG